MEKLEHTPMSDKVKERIEKEANEYCKEKYTPKIAEFAKGVYIHAATAERPKAWNEAIESVKEALQELELKECEYKECAVPDNLNYEYFKGKRDAYEFSVKLIRRALEWQGEKLKHKQP